MRESRKKWVWRKARDLIDLVGSVSKEHFGSILKMIGHRSGFIIADHGELMLSVAQCVAIRDHIGTGSNGLYRLKQGLEALVPVLKGLLIPSNIRNKMTLKEREGVVPSRVVEVNCTITRKGNRRGMCTYYYCEYPAQLVANMIRRMYLDDAHEDSFSFSSLKDKFVVAIGIDKSDKDLVGTMRICNRKKGNSGLHVQAFSCLEGPVAECYPNEIITFGNTMYPTMETMQHLVDDFYFGLVFFASRGKNRLCSSSLFLPVPNHPQLTQRKLGVTYLPLAVNESLVIFDDARNNPDADEDRDTITRDAGLPPEIVIPPNQSDISVRLIHAKDTGSMMVGYQVLIDDVVLSTIKLYHSFELRGFKPEEIQVYCKQVSGHLANDNKQINILTGQCSCTVKHPMACCMVAKENLGVAPEWIQRRLIEEKVASVEWIFSLSSALANSEPVVYSEFVQKAIDPEILERIAEYADCKITSDAPRRTGELSFDKTSERWDWLTVGGKFCQTKKERDEANTETGSSFHPPVCNFHADKQNGGIFHSPQGHTTHFTDSIIGSICEYMKGCEWEGRLTELNGEIIELRTDLLEESNVGDFQAGELLKKELTKIRGRITRNINLAKQIEKDSTSRSPEMNYARDLREKTILLEHQMQDIKDKRRDHARSTDAGMMNKIQNGLDELQTVFNEGRKEESNLPRNELHFAALRAIESRGKGRFDHKRTGTEQTNGNGMNFLQNFDEVTKALLGMYSPENHIHQWLRKETLKWEELAAALFDVHCFLKSQKKRTPIDCDNKLYTLWKAWQKAFPGKSFNKFHGLFCTIRHFVHKYHMTGRVSEESNESFNGVLARVKRLLASMPATVGRVELINARTQANLKGEILEPKLIIMNAGKGSKRGPYKIRARDNEGTKIVTSVVSYVEFKGKRYFQLATGNMLPEKWRDIYDWYAGRVAPKAWRDALAKTRPSTMSALDMAKEGFAA